MFTHLPRAGTVRAAPLLAEIGDARGGHPSEDALAAAAGVSPSARASGRSRAVVLRQGCNRRLRQALVDLADGGRQSSPWAKAVYDRARARGARHAHAIRVLARAWIRVISGDDASWLGSEPTACHDHVMVEDIPGLASARDLLVGQEVSAVCFVRDYVELHFDGPIVRALTDPIGLYGCQPWRFPHPSALALMRKYIGQIVDDFTIVPDRYAQLAFGEHSFTIPLDQDARTGPEALHLVGVGDHGRLDTSRLWTC